MDVALSNRLTPTNGLSTGLVGSASAPSSDTEAGRAAEVKQPPSQGPAAGGALELAVSSIQDFVQTIRRDLNFAVDDSSGKMVVKVTDRASGEVIRQIPTEEALRLAENLEEARSLLFEAQA